MKLLKKVLIGSALALAFSAAQAAPITVGGITWDPDYSDSGETDFTTKFDFTQWFGTTKEAVGVAPKYTDAISISTVFGSLNGSSAASGYYLKGAGEVYRVNENNKNNGDVFCTGCELTYAFGGIGLNKNGTFDVTDAWARLYVNSTTPNFAAPVSNQAEVDDAISGSKWLDLKFTSLGFISGNVKNGLVSAELAVVGGTAAFNFQPGTLTYSASARFLDGAKYSSDGNGSMTGNTIPEPGSLALFGLGMLGAAALRRRN
ncbi:MAG: PEP-CTERM sorting domain-containing protein, partial [Burkholderiaceae bacterium]|nr:PEP-CTERM sorting domain-containing protein [Burkholderiaceae bacterium]